MNSVTNGNTFVLDEHPYIFPDDEPVILDELMASSEVFYKRQRNVGSIYYYNIPASFDIEDSSFRLDIPMNGKMEHAKISTMYVWQFSINGKVIIGRTWDEFKKLISDIEEIVSFNHRLIVYVHYLGHEFSFIQNQFQWEKVFCSSERTPIYAITKGGVEFRDSYILTGKSLAKSADDLNKYKVAKMSGDLDYTLIRGTKTKLSKKELGYCVHDCLVVDAIIQEKIEQESRGIAGIPLTNTGYVRRFLREKCFDKDNRKNYSALMDQLTLTSHEYVMLKRAFAGGFTHANVRYVGRTLRGRIDSFDFTSSYPAVILSEPFPMSRGKRLDHVSRETFRKILKTKLSIFDICFNGLKMSDNVSENIISASKCFKLENAVLNNGRVVSADRAVTTITNVDLKYISKFYTWDSIQIGTLYYYEKGILPKPIIEAVLELYGAKTTLKGISEKIVEYMVKKGMLNSVYGCMVTDIIKALVTFDNGEGWKEEFPDMDESIENYNNSKNRFLFYPWGVFVTAYARRNLFRGIYEFNSGDCDDYIYSDTDSIKCLNADKHMDFINSYNSEIINKVKAALRFYGIDESKAEPLTIKGVKKPIGVWDFETDGCPYHTFKTLGAKRYMYTQDTEHKDENGNKYTVKDELHITIAGLSKGAAAYIGKQDDPWEFFDDKMFIPSDETGKLTHTYIDSPMDGILTDYNGESMEFHELSGVNLEPASFSLSETNEFKDYCEGFHNVFM